jgi:hypothetical protein
MDSIFSLKDGGPKKNCEIRATELLKTGIIQHD